MLQRATKLERDPHEARRGHLLYRQETCLALHVRCVWQGYRARPSGEYEPALQRSRQRRVACRDLPHESDGDFLRQGVSESRRNFERSAALRTDSDLLRDRRSQSTTQKNHAAGRFRAVRTATQACRYLASFSVRVRHVLGTSDDFLPFDSCRRAPANAPRSLDRARPPEAYGGRRERARAGEGLRDQRRGRTGLAAFSGLRRNTAFPTLLGARATDAAPNSCVLRFARTSTPAR